MTPDLTCSACRERLPLYRSGNLSTSERMAVERHLAHCKACQAEGRLWSAVASALDASDKRIPPDAQEAAAWLTLRSALTQRSPETSFSEHPLRLVDSDTPSSSTRWQKSAQSGRARRPAFALPAVALLVAMIVAIFGVIGSHMRHEARRVVTTTGAPTTCAASALHAMLPQGAGLSDISMTSPRDGWAVGWIGDPSSATAPKTLLVRFQNCQWQPVADNIPAAELLSVSMRSASDGWAVGVMLKDFNPTPTSDNPQHQWGGVHVIVLHYDGSQWRSVSVSGVGAAIYAKVRMTSSGDGWMLVDGGGLHVTPYTKAYAYTLFHYQNGEWSQVPLTFDPSHSLILWDIAAVAPNDCWVVGYGTQSGGNFMAAHYHDGTWTTWSGQHIGVTYPAMYSVSMSAPDDVWLSGSYPYKDANGDHVGPLVAHFDGVHWTREQVSNVQDSMADPSLMKIAAAAPSDVWAFTWKEGGGSMSMSMAHKSAGVWTWSPPPEGIIDIKSVSFVSPSDGYAIAQTSTGTAMLHYDHGVWTGIPAQ
ncbi:MAG TPA: zf-HC2 domain-containing protein [Ktedonobacterales bacterium]